MIRVTELGGRAVVDLDSPEKLGRIDRVVLDPEARRVAGFVVSRGSSLLKSGDHLTVPATCVHAVGPDAVTVHWQAPPDESETMLKTLPRASDLIGRKVVSDQGRLLGTVSDILIDEHDGRIVGYTLADAADSLLDLVTRDENGRARAPYLRADADLRTGHELIVAPEGAVSGDYTIGDDAPATRNWHTGTLREPKLLTASSTPTI